MRNIELFHDIHHNIAISTPLTDEEKEIRRKKSIQAVQDRSNPKFKKISSSNEFLTNKSNVCVIS